MKFKLSEEVISTDDLKDVIEEVKQFKKWFSHNQVRLRVSRRHKVKDRPELSNAAEALIEQAKDGKQLTSNKLEELIGFLENYLDKSPTMRITLAAIPSLSVKHSIAAWLRANVSPALLVDFRFNSALLGGMVVVCGSHIYDWSLRRQLLESKAKLDGVLKSV